MHYNAPHPHRTHAVNRIAPSDAARFVTRYLTNAAENAALRPDAQLTEEGPVSGMVGGIGGGQSLGLTLHNLARIEKGLRGEWMGNVELELEKDEGTNTPNVDIGKKGKRKRQAARDVEETNEWVDKDEFERMQEDVVEMGAGEEAVEGTRELAAASSVAGMSKTATDTVDKDLRKKLKKERRKKERQEKSGAQTG